jgi:hypothetical protein
MLEGEISVLYKKNDRDDVRNYRPITLLNSDYKIYTKLLAQRMKGVVHEFVSNTQKGFVPKEIIHDCTMLLNLVEAYINDEPEKREGIFLFFDMEKAFDRVSFEFLNKALDATGFGPNFRSMVKLMYDEDNAPKRRIYANGYLGEWFEIKSGVAQGCPLSPLLFLLVAEALKMTICENKEVEGIEIGGTSYLISQFADDTTLGLKNDKSIKPAEKSIAKWCRATGMKENATKREGIAMGKLRNKQMPGPTKWVKTGETAKSLGYPIGNNVSHEAFWNKKQEAIQKLANKWKAMKRSTIFGRNLLVQACYFGRLRYWLYNLHMNKKLKNKVQADTNQLLWTKDPDLEHPKRFRRFVAQETAIGPRSKGGLNMMDWDIHATCFTAQWIIKYVDPTDAQWKTLLDHMLLTNKKGKITYPEGRMILYTNLTGTMKGKLLHRLPKKAKYIRACLRDFWNLKLTPAEEPTKRHIASESLWWNHSFEIMIDWRHREFLRDTVQVTLLSDIMNKKTNRILKRDEWLDWIEEDYKDETGVELDNESLITYTDAIMSAIKQIPDEIKKAIRNPKARYKPSGPNSDGRIVGIMSRDETKLMYGKFQTSSPNNLRALWLDSTSTPREKSTIIKIDGRELFQVQQWRFSKHDKRIAGLKQDSFPVNTKWKLGNAVVRLWHLSIGLMTKEKQLAKMKKPAAQKGWEIRMPGIGLPWPLIWKLKPMYVSPRDIISWLKLKHRNLYVANKDEKCQNKDCLACEDETESMLHLAECNELRENYFIPIMKLLIECELEVPEDEDDFAPYLIFGRLTNFKVCDRESAAVLALAWRCLYAEIISCRADNMTFNINRPLKRCFAMLHSRVTAYGEKWKKWFSRTKHTSKTQLVPKKHQNYKLIHIDPNAKYELNKAIKTMHENINK